MSLAIVGMGLVTPFGGTPAEHVFYVRAHVPAPPASPFETADGERVEASYCRWLGAAMGLEERLAQLGDYAAKMAFASVHTFVKPSDLRVLSCTSKPRPGRDALAAKRLDKLLGARSSNGNARQFLGDAGAFGALKEAKALVQADPSIAVLVVATDSYIAPATLEDRVKFPPSYWDFDPPPASEGAAAMVVMDPTAARRANAKILGTVDGAAIAAGTSHDDNDEPVDGTAMVVALRQLSEKARPRAAYGPWRVDLLRRDEFQIASARASFFALDAEFRCLEAKVGRLGAASGLANAVYGVAVHAHKATDNPDAAQSPLLAWAISPDGTRGAGLFTGGRP